MFWKPIFQQGYIPKILLLAHHIISQTDKDYYFSYKYAASPLSFSRSSKQSVWAKKRKHYMQSLSIHIWVLPAKLPLLKLNKTSCQQQSVGLHRGRSHIFCTDISHPSAAGKKLQLLLTAVSCNSSFCSQWSETLKSLGMPKITSPACFLTSGSTHEAIPPGTRTAKHHAAPFCHCWTGLGVLPDSDLADNLATPAGSPQVQDSRLGVERMTQTGAKGSLNPPCPKGTHWKVQQESWTRRGTYAQISFFLPLLKAKVSFIFPPQSSLLHLQNGEVPGSNTNSFQWGK